MKKGINQRLAWVLKCVVIMLFVAACQPRANTDITPLVTMTKLQIVDEVVTAATFNSEATKTPITSSVPTSINTPSPSATILLLPTPNLTPAQTPKPTLTSDESARIIHGWFEYPPCLLPCWWNLYPGVTDWVDVNQLLDFLALEGATRRNRNQEGELRNIREVWFSYPEDSHSTYSYIFYATPDGVLSTISQRIQGIGVDHFSLSFFLTQYGQPDEIMMSAIWGTSSGDVPFRFVLGYWQKGFAVVFREFVPGEIAIHWTGVGKGCFQQTPRENITPHIELLLWNAEKNLYQWDDMYDLMFGIEPGHPYLPLEIGTGITVEHFYETYREGVEQVCLDTPISLWDRENFYWCDAQEKLIPVTDTCLTSDP
jgi:hypothetical protein